MASVPGGASVTTGTTGTDAATLQSVLNTINGGNPVTVSTDLSGPGGGSTLYSVPTPASGATYTLPSGGAGLVVAGSVPVTIDGDPNATNEVLAGNNAGDTYNLGAGSGTVVEGSGNDTVNIAGGTVKLDQGEGSATVNISSGNIVQQGSGTLTVNGAPGSNEHFFSTSGATVNVGDGTSLTLGTGDDTLNALGSATIYGGYNSITFQGGTNSTVFAGGGNETLIGGTGTTAFYGGLYASGSDSMVGGSGPNTFVAGNNRETMVGAGTSNTYEFTSKVPGSSAVIADYNPSTDTVLLQGYTASDVTAITSTAAGDVVTLSDGTLITFAGDSAITLANLTFSQTPDANSAAIQDLSNGATPSATTDYSPFTGVSTVLGAGTPGGTTGVTLTADPTSSSNVLVGTLDANDTFNMGAGSGSIIAGNGNDTFNIGSGSAHVATGSGANTFNQDGGNFFVTGAGSDTFNVAGGTSDFLVSTSGGRVNLGDGSQLTLGEGDDTIYAAGSATVLGGYGNDIFYGATNSTVYASNNIETLIGGTGQTNFYGSTSANGYVSMVGGSGGNFLQGGVGADTMVSGSLKGGTDVFNFSSTVSGGNHTIDGFSLGSDTINLQGYSASQETTSMVNGNTVISLTDGTTITLVGVKDFSTGHLTFGK